MIQNKYLIQLFIFMLVCGLSEWRRICVGFYYCLLISVLSSGTYLSRVEDWDPINRLNPVTLLCLSQVRIWISNSICYVLLFLCSIIWGERRWLLVSSKLVEMLTITVLNFLFNITLNVPNLLFYLCQRISSYIINLTILNFVSTLQGRELNLLILETIWLGNTLFLSFTSRGLWRSHKKY